MSEHNLNIGDKVAYYDSSGLVITKIEFETENGYVTTGGMEWNKVDLHRISLYNSQVRDMQIRKLDSALRLDYEIQENNKLKDDVWESIRELETPYHLELNVLKTLLNELSGEDREEK
jgi:hypothetical protein